MNDILDALSARIKAPYFGYALLAFIALNWRGIFLLAATDGLPQERLKAFDGETSSLSLIVLPLLFGALVAAISPWIRFAFEFVSKLPFELTDNLHLESEHKKTIRKTELERSRSYFFAEKEEELIERAKRDKVVSEIDDTELKERLMHEIETLRRERDLMSESINGNKDKIQLSSVEADLLKAAAKSSGAISRNEYLGGRSIQVGSMTYGQKNPREFAKYDSALKSLISKGLVHGIGHAGELYELTNNGWLLADTL